MEIFTEFATLELSSALAKSDDVICPKWGASYADPWGCVVMDVTDGLAPISERTRRILLWRLHKSVIFVYVTHNIILYETAFYVNNIKIIGSQQSVLSPNA
jgi:hypothetical protein